MKTIIKSLLVIALLIPSGQGLAADYTNPSFSAVCYESSARTYMAATDWKGKEDKDSWSKKGIASPEEGWEFHYKGGNKIEIDGKDIPIVTQHEGVIIALSHGSSGVGSNAWLYAIHLGLKRVVASMVNGYGHVDGKLSGILTTSIELTCEFTNN